jgi:hypothetical protein
MAEREDDQQIIVAEISKSYINGEPVSSLAPLAQLFEQVIAVNRGRGYRLAHYALNRMMTRPDELNETIIAVFERIDHANDEAVIILRDIIYASDRCHGHRGCEHSMEPWQRGRALIMRLDEA